MSTRHIVGSIVSSFMAMAFAGCAGEPADILGEPELGVSAQAEVSLTGFADVFSYTVGRSQIVCLKNRGVISGYPCGGQGEPCGAPTNPNNWPYYRPDNNVTRALGVRVVVSAMGWPFDTSGLDYFTDIHGTLWYAYIKTAMNQGAICMSQGSLFRPNDWMTRGDMAYVITHAKGWVNEQPEVSLFNDAANPLGPFAECTATSFWSEIEVAGAHKLVSGYECNPNQVGCMSNNEGCMGAPYPDKYYRPLNNLTRGQMAKIVGLAVGCP